MMKLAIVLALAVAVSATCIYEEEKACVKKNAVECGSDWCYGHCAVEYKKACDTKVWYKEVCEEADICVDIKTPCGHDGDDGAGLYCSYDETCVTDKKCKLIPAYKKGSYYGWHSKSMPGGYFEVCKDVYSCAAVDAWDMDEDEVEITCTKEYEVVEGDCKSLWANTDAWGGVVISEPKFYKMNKGFSCDKKIVGKLVCVEADITIKAASCGGASCAIGQECVTKDVCTEVAVEKPVCAKKAAYTCLKTGSASYTACGNNICSPSQKCEITRVKKCAAPHTPSQQVVYVPVPAPGTPTVPVVPVPTPAVPVPVPGPTPTTPPTAPPAGPTVIPSASVISSSLADAIGTVTITDAVNNGDGVAYTSALATKGTEVFSDSRSYAFDETALAYTDANIPAGSDQEAAADADATSNP